MMNDWIGVGICIWLIHNAGMVCCIKENTISIDSITLIARCRIDII